METYFPADVSVRVSGEIADAQKLFPAARQLLYRALKVQDDSGRIVRLLLPGEDGSLITAFLAGKLKQLYVQPGPKSVPSEPEEPETIKPETTERKVVADIVNGLITPGTALLGPSPDALNPDDSTDYTLHQYHPTRLCATIYNIDFAWQDADRLGVESDPAISNQPMQAVWPKPSMYTGAMKRVVQALYGIGKTFNGTIEGDDPDDSAFVQAKNHYDCRWVSSHGIRRKGKTPWLIEISKARGVLAMPLPIFDGTDTDEYRENLDALGDTESLGLVLEFGGLPSGDTFPTDLEAAITEGTVYRLLTAVDVLAFYHDATLNKDKNAFFTNCGWAFSNSGNSEEAHNTCCWYSHPEISQAPFVDASYTWMWLADGHNGAPPEERYMRAEHWKIQIELPDLTDALDNTIPKATLSLVEMQPLEAPNSKYLVARAKILLADNTFGVGETNYSTGYGYYPVDDNVSVGSGFDPSLYLQNWIDSSGGTGVGNGFGQFIDERPSWSHSALLLVPRERKDSQLDRFVFWGRSQVNPLLSPFPHQEPAAAAPVLVFYVGEELEIVKRQAERYEDDFSYRMGDFFGTSLDLRGDVPNIPFTMIGTFKQARVVDAHVGLLIPQCCREGYLFFSSVYGYPELNGTHLKTVGFFADLGTIEFWRFDTTVTTPDFFDGSLSAFPSWWTNWSNIWFDLGKATIFFNTGQAAVQGHDIGVQFSMNVNAGPVKAFAAHAELYLGWNWKGPPYYYAVAPRAVTPGFPVQYRYTLLDGITLTNVDPVDMTFVGVV